MGSDPRKQGKLEPAKLSAIRYSRYKGGSMEPTESDLDPPLLQYCYLGIDFSSDGSWDKRLKSLITHNRQKLGGL